MNKILDIKKWYLSNFELFEHSLNGESLKPIHKLRKDAIEKFSDMNFPTTHDEDWRFTNISPIFDYNFNLCNDKHNLSQKDIEHFKLEKLNGNFLAFVNGHFAKDLSDIKNVSGNFIVGSISEEIEKDSELFKKHFGKYAKHNQQIFTALSTAFAKDGAFIFVPEGKIIEEPVQFLFIADSRNENFLIQPRNLFIAEKNAQVKIIEHYVSLSESTYFTNAVTEIYCGENSIVEHVKLQEESNKAFHISRTEILQERSSNFVSHSISLGAEITRNDVNTKFNNEGAESTINGLYLLSGNQLYDTHTIIDHAVPQCTSHEHYKGILTDKSRGVFNGKVIVRPDAQKTNAFQENNNIILSNEAIINTKPQLEIFADDVKCSHGATIGQLDDDALFYLKSRGIGEEQSKIMLLHAFASDIVKLINIKQVRHYLEKILDERFNK